MRKFFGIYLLTLFGLLINFSDQLVVSCDPSIGENRCGFFPGLHDIENKKLIKAFEVNKNYAHLLLFVTGRPDSKNPQDRITIRTVDLSNRYKQKVAAQLDCKVLESDRWYNTDEERNEVILLKESGGFSSDENSKIKEAIESAKDERGEPLKPLFVNIYYCGGGEVVEVNSYVERKRMNGAKLDVFSQMISYGPIQNLYVSIPYSFHWFNNINRDVLSFIE